MLTPKTALAALIVAFTPTVLAEYCVAISGEGHTGFGVTSWMKVEVNGALICNLPAQESQSYDGPCGDGGSAGGTLKYNWTPIQGPFDATYCDEKGRCTTVTIGDDWQCEASNCCGGNIPCQCWACAGGARVCTES